MEKSDMGYFVLQGGAEFGGEMKASDLRAIELAGGMDARISILPTAAAPDNNHARAGKKGRDWFAALGARHASVVAVIDRQSAADPELARELEASGLIYLLGGFPAYLAEVFKGTRCWKAVLKAHAKGAVLAGSSAGAMVLCRYLYDPRNRRVLQGLDLLPDACVLPHHNAFGRHWAPQLQKDLPAATLIGIDEETGMVNDGRESQWHVYGRGGVTLYRGHDVERYNTGTPFSIG